MPATTGLEQYGGLCARCDPGRRLLQVDVADLGARAVTQIRRVWESRSSSVLLGEVPLVQAGTSVETHVGARVETQAETHVGLSVEVQATSSCTLSMAA